MKPSFVIAVLVLGLGASQLAGCSPARQAEAETADAAANAAVAESSAMVADAASASPSPATAGAIAPHAPAFAVYVPGAEPTSEPVLAMGPDGPGGMVEFTTSTSPDEVITFYRQKAEAAGLSTVATMNRDGTLSYTASDGLSGQGQLLNVVATPAASGSNVHLDWSAGR